MLYKEQVSVLFEAVDESIASVKSIATSNAVSIPYNSDLTAHV